jgi:hypothetical protein
MASGTIFSNFSEPVENKAIILLRKRIATDEFKEPILAIRNLIANGEKEKAQKQKTKLLAFTPSGTFKEKRIAANLDLYSGFIHLDFDHIPKDDFEKSFDIIKSDPHTSFCFRSPSGDGLKVFVEVYTKAEYHETAYQQVLDYFQSLTGLQADEKCKDITRLCFFSYDPDMYSTISNTKFQVSLPNNLEELQEPIIFTPPPKKETAPPSHILSGLFDKQILFTNQKQSYQNGNRNNYIYMLASNCNRVAIPMEVCLELCTQNYDLDNREIKASVKSAYENHPLDFGKYAKLANSKDSTSIGVTKEITPDEDYLKLTPIIPVKVYENLPNLLKKGTSVFSDPRKRDVFFTSALCILSGCLPNVSGVYGGERVYPQLFTFVIAPAASGKGVMKNAKRLADAYHDRVIEGSRAAQKNYEGELIDYKALLQTRKKGEPTPEKPEEPKFKLAFIPADCSKARMIEHLAANGEEGIICETEADTLSGAKKQDWGDYSALLRAAFQHERYASSRKTNNEFSELKEPKLAVALTGTPAQAPRLISSSEDGLFSRFVFYAFKNDLEWLDPSPFAQKVVLNDHFDALSKEVLSMIDFLALEKSEFYFSIDQWEFFNKSFRKSLFDVATFTSEDAASVVFRLGLITFRIAMILTAIRKFENGESNTQITCSDEDFHSAISISEVYLKHSILMFNNLPNQSEIATFKGGDNKKLFFEALPADFQRKEAVELGKRFSLSPRSVDAILNLSVGKTLTKLKSGHYQKLL